jgi:hypothetical protein
MYLSLFTSYSELHITYMAFNFTTIRQTMEGSNSFLSQQVPAETRENKDNYTKTNQPPSREFNFRPQQF